jgi:hypothetical protein
MTLKDIEFELKSGAERHVIHSQIEIAASARTVWDVLTDFEQYPDWNPLFKSVRTDFVVGSPVRVTERMPSGKPVSFTSRWVRIEPGRHCCWEGKFIAPFLWHGFHSFMLTERDQGRTLFTHRETYTGLLSKSLGLEALKPAFDAMNVALKVRAERLGRQP